MPTPRPRHILISGASGGIGSALARHYAAAGLRLTLMGRAQERLEAVAAECQARGAVTDKVVVDIRDAADVEAALVAADAAQPVDLVIANAGVGGTRSLAGPLGEDPAAAREIVAVNFQGVVNTVSVLAPRLMARRGGHIVIVSSLAAAAPLGLAPSYAASKAGASAYARNLRLLLHGAGVGMTLALPGFVDTAMSRDLPGPKPGLMSADAAAARIAAAVAANRAEIAFPLGMKLLVTAAGLAPDWLVKAILTRWQERTP